MNNCKNTQDINVCDKIENDYWSDQQCKCTWMVVIGPHEDDKKIFIENINFRSEVYDCEYDMSYNRFVDYSHRISCNFKFGCIDDVEKRNFPGQGFIRFIPREVWDEFKINDCCVVEGNYFFYNSFEYLELNELTSRCARI